MLFGFIREDGQQSCCMWRLVFEYFMMMMMMMIFCYY